MLAAVRGRVGEFCGSTAVLHQHFAPGGNLFDQLVLIQKRSWRSFEGDIKEGSEPVKF